MGYANRFGCIAINVFLICRRPTPCAPNYTIINKQLKGQQKLTSV